MRAASSIDSLYKLKCNSGALLIIRTNSGRLKMASRAEYLGAMKKYVGKNYEGGNFIICKVNLRSL